MTPRACLKSEGVGYDVGGLWRAGSHAPGFSSASFPPFNPFSTLSIRLFAFAFVSRVEVVWFGEL